MTLTGALHIQDRTVLNHRRHTRGGNQLPADCNSSRVDVALLLARVVEMVSSSGTAKIRTTMFITVGIMMHRSDSIGTEIACWAK